MKCIKCSGKMTEKKDATPEGVEYRYYQCNKCGEGDCGYETASYGC